MRLAILGSGSAWSAVGSNAAYCLDGRVLVDCGTPVHRVLPRVGVDVGDVRTVLLTHFHADHTYMLPLYLGALAFDRGGGPLSIAGPPGTLDYVMRIVRTGYGSQLETLIRNALTITDVVLQDGCDVDVDGYRVRARAVRHSLGPSLAYAVTGPDGATVGFSGDSTMCAGLRAVAAMSDLMVIECTEFDRPVGSHLWAGEVSALVDEMPGTRFLVSHLSERRPLRGAIIAHDLLTLDVPAPGTAVPAPPAEVAADDG